MMSGPYCKDCHYAWKAPLMSEDRYQCTDTSKDIIDRNGNIAIESPEVHAMYTCSNFTTKEKE